MPVHPSMCQTKACIPYVPYQSFKSSNEQVVLCCIQKANLYAGVGGRVCCLLNVGDTELLRCSLNPAPILLPFLPFVGGANRLDEGGVGFLRCPGFVFDWMSDEPIEYAPGTRRGLCG